ncbi:hypothetical protein Tco_1430010 [Tanacetum coccineum]
MRRVPLLVLYVGCESDYDSWMIRIHSQGLHRLSSSTNLNQQALQRRYLGGGDMWRCYARIRSSLQVIVDPLAYIAHTTSAPAMSTLYLPSPQPYCSVSSNVALMASMTMLTVHDGHIVTEQASEEAPVITGYIRHSWHGGKIMPYGWEANEKGDVLDADSCAIPR